MIRKLTFDEALRKVEPVPAILYNFKHKRKKDYIEMIKAHNYVQNKISLIV